MSSTFPDRRREDVLDPTQPERRKRRHFHTMSDKLAAVAGKHDGERKFNGDPITELGDFKDESQ